MIVVGDIYMHITMHNNNALDPIVLTITSLPHELISSCFMAFGICCAVNYIEKLGVINIVCLFIGRVLYVL